MRHGRIRIAAGVGCWLALGIAAARSATESADAETQAVFARIATAMQDRDYPAAIEQIDAALAAEQGDQLDELAYLKGRALHHLGRYDEAAEVFDDLSDRFPDSTWQRRARFAKAAALARKGDYRSAEIIYREQAESLLSEDRRMELAEVLLDFAEAYFDPPDDTQQPDYTRARAFFEQALEIGLVDARAAQVRLLIGKCFQQQDDYQNAAQVYEQFVESHGETDFDLSELQIDARYRLGWCRLQLNQREPARRVFEDLLASGLDRAVDLSEDSRDRFAQAMFHLATTYGFPTPDSAEDLDLGLAAIARFLEKYPDHKLASRARLLAAQSLMHRGRFAAAATRLEALTQSEPKQNVDDVATARFLIGVCRVRQQQFAEATSAWRTFLVKHPSHPQWDEAQRAIIDTRYAAAEFARQEKDFAKARELWQQFLVDYPLDPRGAEILLKFGQMHAEEQAWEQAIQAWQQVVSKYPGTEQASQAQYAIAEAYETELADLEQALQEYRKLKWGSQVGPAQQRVAALTSRQLVLKTDRVYRSDEQPQVSLTLRNIESVEVKIYAIDLETYFRKMHLAEGIEQLDTALIAPDASFTYEVPDYVRYQEHEQSLAVPLPSTLNRSSPSGEATGDPAAAADTSRDWPAGESAVLAVTVSSETLTATTLVIRSDLDMIIKSSREELFVFAENMRTGAPWPNARILVSDGSQIIQELSTDDEGIVQHAIEELKSSEDVRVFAVADGHSASNRVSLQGIGVSQGLQTKGFLQTDRPAYRPGQMVHIRGVIRRVADDRYVIDDGKLYEVRVLDPRGRQLFHGTTSLNKFGCFAAYVELPPQTPAGEYRIDVKEPQRDGGRQNFVGSFLVQEYQLEPVRLVIDTERSVFYRGETIEGVIRAEFYYGTPLVGREIRYQLAGEPLQTARTNAQGEVRFEFPTRKFRESMPLPLAVTLSERNLSVEKMFILATRGFSIGVSTVRDVFLAGEPFETELLTTDAEGQPVARELTVKLFAQTVVNGKRGERLINTESITTDSEGHGRVTLIAENGGQHIVRVSGVDRFSNPITAEHHVQISDDDDRVRLRILADQHTFKAGDTATVRVHWREPRALALVTFQGARILGHRLVHLEQGSNEIEVPMFAALAPNFDLSVAAMTDPRDRLRDDGSRPARFHEATTPITVRRELDVTLEVARTAGGNDDDAFVPGEELSVTILTRDSQGKPVTADVSLALVEQAILDRFPNRRADITAYFRGNRREAAVRTTSTAQFTYTPSTQPIDTALLAERSRRELREREELQLGEAIEMFAADDDPFADSDGESVALGETEDASPVDANAASPGYDLREVNGQGLQGGVDGHDGRRRRVWRLRRRRRIRRHRPQPIAGPAVGNAGRAVRSAVFQRAGSRFRCPDVWPPGIRTRPPRSTRRFRRHRSTAIDGHTAGHRRVRFAGSPVWLFEFDSPQRLGRQCRRRSGSHRVVQ